METEILIQQLKTKDFAVFGTGFVAEMFYEALKETGLSSGLRCCIVSKAREGETFHGRPVYSAGSFRLPDDMMLCIAVHESAYGEISNEIKSIWDATRYRGIRWSLSTADLSSAGLRIIQTKRRSKRPSASITMTFMNCSTGSLHSRRI